MLAHIPYLKLGSIAGDQNVAIGDLSLSYKEGEYVSRNTAVGFEAMRGMEAGDKYMNVALGWRSGKGAGDHDDCLYLGCTQGSTNSSATGFENRLMIGNQYHTLIDGKMENNNPFLHVHGDTQIMSGNLRVGDDVGAQNYVSQIVIETPWLSNSIDIVSQITSKGRALSAGNVETFTDLISGHYGNGSDGYFEFKCRKNNNSGVNTILTLNKDGSNTAAFYSVLQLHNLPTNTAGLASGTICKDSNGFLKVV